MENDILSNVWPEWHTVKRLGSGSFGIVYEAVRKDSSLESHAAIKVISIPPNESELDSIRSEGLSDEATRTYLQNLVNDFINEIQLMESFKGTQNIVSVEDYKVVEKTDEIGWDIYIRMELLTPLNRYISDKKLSEQEVIKIGIDICTALELCAKKDVIHRDIKPENIFINQFGDFKLGDFGIARKLENATSSLSRKGTPNYIAPEIERGSRYDATVDLYSLGLVLYRFMNNNKLPFLNNDHQLPNPNERAKAIRRRLDGEPLPFPCDASPEMAQVIMCACDFDPRKRFANAAAMKNALLNIAKDSGSRTASNTVSSTNAFNSSLNATINANNFFSADNTVNANSGLYEKQINVAPAPLGKPVNASPAPFDNTIKAVSPQFANNTGENFRYTPQPVGSFGGKKKNNTPLIIAAAALVCAIVFISSITSKSDNKGDTSSLNETTSISDTVTSKAYEDSEFYEDSESSKSSRIAKTSPASQFGENVIELHDVPDGFILDMDNVEVRSGRDYNIGTESWSTAFWYKGSNMAGTPYVDYLLEEKFERLEFRTTPDLDNFGSNIVINILVVDPETEEILYKKSISRDPSVTEVSVDVSGRNRIRIKTGLESGGGDFIDAGFLFIKDAYLYPVGYEE